MYADILVEVKGIDQTFTYEIDEKFIKDIQIGSRVLVPFINRNLEGFVLKVHNDKPDFKLKKIVNLVDTTPVLNEEMLKLGLFIKKKTLANLITCYQTMLPKALKAKEGATVNKKYITYIELVVPTYLAKNSAQQFILDELASGRKAKDEFKGSSIETLIKHGIVKEIKEEMYRLDQGVTFKDSLVTLNDDQNKIVKEIKDNLNTYYPALLYGVTGSGKTEVYMHIIKEVLNNKKEAIVLVPEISLTPQLIDSFKKRFGDNIAVIHSRLSDGERYDEWRKIVRGEVSIVIGARSAIFAPFNNLGVIIIDEEHSQTYKQENSPKYNTVDIALWRSKYHNIPLILGSATPSLESYARSEVREYHLLNLPNRVNNNFPVVTLIDLKDEMRHNHKILSRLLIEKINDRLAKNEQIILLLNRRGYSTVISCHNCGYVDKCPACDIPLTYHKTSNTMRCHYCGKTSYRLTACPTCKSKDINEFGLGTQRLEEYLQTVFNKARIIRMDIDTTSGKNAHEKIITSFRNHEYDILLGTQMIAKGLDFPNVTLVGVINGDATLNIPDFRSAERTFQLLNQVAGRAGRASKAGEVIIQAYNIDHYSIKKAKEHDYLGFYVEELKIRKVLKYPPYYNICLIKTYSTDYEMLDLETNKIISYLKDELPNMTILGPSNGVMPKINNVYNMQIIIKYIKREEIIKCLEYVNLMYKTSNKIKVEIDLNPSRI